MGITYSSLFLGNRTLYELKVPEHVGGLVRKVGKMTIQARVEEQRVEDKQQRAKLSQKRHKSKTFHVNKKKDVPPFLQNLVKKA
jgi:hypothetical protein